MPQNVPPCQNCRSTTVNQTLGMFKFVLVGHTLLACMCTYFPTITLTDTKFAFNAKLAATHIIGKLNATHSSLHTVECSQIGGGGEQKG